MHIPPDDGPTINSDETAFEIVDLLLERDGAGVTEIATEIGVAKSTVYKHLQTMVKHDFATKIDDEYHVGLRFLDFGMYARRQQLIYQLSRDRIDELADETGELVWCQTHENGQCVYLYGAAGSHSVYPPEFIGNRTPMHQLAGGKVMLANFSRETVDKIVDRYGLETATEHTISDRDELHDALETIRDRGVAFNREESTLDLYAVSTAVVDSDGEVLGSIGISGPKHRMRGEPIESELPKLLLGTANELEFNLEHREFSTDAGFTARR